jgi:hypothetical protein
MKLFEAITFYKTVALIDIYKFRIDHGGWVDTFKLSQCDEYFKYLNLNVADVTLDGSLLVFRVLIPEVEE